MARKIYRVVPSGTRWNVEYQGEVVSSHENKEGAVTSGGGLAQANQPSQLVIHKFDGTIDTEHTYGEDPFPPQG